VNLEKLRSYCLSLPAATEHIQWGADLVFKIGGKMFAVAATEPDEGHRLSFKCSDETFAELLEHDGIVPAPYMARAKWVALETFDALPDREIQERIRESYDLVFAKLTKKQQAEIGGARAEESKAVAMRPAAKKSRAKKPATRKPAAKKSGSRSSRR
jgi:predicted DNA-binding protein (MmcQ/YjbR family)